MSEFNLHPLLDEKEKKERQHRLDALAKENPTHFTDLVTECRRESEDQNQAVREVWDDTMSAYLNSKSTNEKEDWQCDVSLNSPFTIIQQAIAIIRKALDSPDRFYNLIPTKKESNLKALLVDPANAVIDAFQGSRGAKFDEIILDALKTGLITGQTKELIPRWVNNQLVWELAEPWNIFRDPNAKPHDPWSGNYWIHEEFVDWWVLKQLDKKGIIKHIDDIKINSTDSQRYKEAARKKQIYTQNSFFNAYSIREYWGVIPDTDGSMIVPDGKFVSSGSTLLTNPSISPYPNLRWPGCGFSPIPHALKFEGHGLLEGVIQLWELLNNLINLHVDNLNWTVNPIRELDLDVVEDDTDDELYPGKILNKRAGGSAARALQLSDAGGNSAEVLANFQLISRLIQNGSFVTEFLEGLPGSRTTITKGEVELKTQQGLGAFNSIAKDIEYGMKKALWASYDVITHHLLPNNEIYNIALSAYPTPIKINFWRERKNLFKYTDIQVSGLSNMLKRMDMIKRIEAAMLKFESPAFNRYIKGYNLLKAYIDILGLDDRYDVLIKPEEANNVDETQQKINQATEIANSGSQSSGGVSGARRLPQFES